MSQAKVDKYKEEKKNRAKTMKRNKIKKAVAVCVAALGLGAIIGIPLGKFIYNKQKEEAAKHRTIASAEFDTWFDKQWAGEYGYLFANNDLGSATDASFTDADEDIEYIDDDSYDFDDEDIEFDDDDIELDEDDIDFEDYDDDVELDDSELDLDDLEFE